MSPRLLVILLVIVLLVGAGVFLASYDVSAPTHTIEKTIPNARILK